MPTNEPKIEYSADLEQLPLEEIVARIKRRMANPANIQPGSQRFDEAFLAGGVDQGMTAQEWDRWWAHLETELDALEGNGINNG